MRRRVSSLAVALLLGACGDPSVDRPDTSIFPSDANTSPPPVPMLDTTPARVPWPVVTLRGRAPDARRIIVDGAGNALVSTILPDESFCIDVPLRAAGSFTLSVRSQNAGGGLSEAPAIATVEFDTSAPPIPGATTCSGGSPTGCMSATEDCTNTRDDDCDGLVDMRDPSCATCDDDVLEPNDDTDAPRIEPGRYDDLESCPGNDDYYAVHLEPSETLDVRVFFSHAMGDLDLRVVAADGTTVLARSESVDDDENASFTAAEARDVYVNVVNYDERPNGYALDIAVGD
jgi:hypothetical protein